MMDDKYKKPSAPGVVAEKEIESAARPSYDLSNDGDGIHISSLVSSFFAKYFPGLIQSDQPPRGTFSAADFDGDLPIIWLNDKECKSVSSPNLIKRE